MTQRFFNMNPRVKFAIMGVGLAIHMYTSITAVRVNAQGRNVYDFDSRHGTGLGWAALAIAILA
jgi:hypothetical protein